MLLLFNELLHFLLLLPQLQQLHLQHSGELKSVPEFNSEKLYSVTHYCHYLQPSLSVNAESEAIAMLIQLSVDIHICMCVRVLIIP